MARLYIPEPKIDLYKDGFDKHDKLGRKATGDKLSDLVERIDDPLVIALDGAWGSGKSVFLKCWVGEHLKREGNTTQTVYFDAFQHDYLDDPLIALTSAISERIERDPESKSAKAWRIAKNAAPFLGKAALRLGTAAFVGKAISLTGDEDGALNDIGDKLSEEGGDIAKSLDEFWKKEDGKRAAMEAFRSALVQLTAPDEQGSPTQKLVIVIDELDRCRPDYALSVLETIKHFFNVDGVHFVLGTNLKELANSVKARHGTENNAERYLQKFYSIRLQLPKLTSVSDANSAPRYYEEVVSQLGQDRDWIHDRIVLLIRNMPAESMPTPRDLERIATLANCVSVSPILKHEHQYMALAILIVLSIIDPKLREASLMGLAEKRTVQRLFGYDSRGMRSLPSKEPASWVFWVIELSQDPDIQITGNAHSYMQSFGLDSNNRHMRLKLLPEIYEKCLSGFSLPDF
ncbi:KAP family P-loop NTPase fold protein [Shimia sp. MMG029]|uniref:KAP family P-loop NTPase fold protein n=1 Tax=Shimia sp. MMG029 TaxID=3021978 RepID=UPI0022FE9C65|nr:P-loop NTPase fold protein [Shimia sp. MMG029]MDA5558487.1 P-loop NTPase fold protein [Shimia sp. MMG029]